MSTVLPTVVLPACCRRLVKLTFAMATGQGRRQSNAMDYVYDLPYEVLNTVSIILDTNNKWKELVTPLGFSVTDLGSFEQNYLQGSSPSQSMITMWGRHNHTINELFCVLSNLNQRWAMSYLREYVSPRYHRLLSLDESAKNVTEQCKDPTVEDLPKPPTPSSATKQKEGANVPMQETACGLAFGNQSMNSHDNYERPTKHVQALFAE